MRFERVKKHPDAQLPQRGTRYSAGYDLYSAEDVLIPSLVRSVSAHTGGENSFVLSQIKDYLKENPVLKPVLVSTGVKIRLHGNCYLSISARSSLPLNALLIVANAPGIIDADYYNNSYNEGEIFVQLLNLSPHDIILQKGDKIAQGVIQKYETLSEEGSLPFKQRRGGFGSTGER